MADPCGNSRAFLSWCNNLKNKKMRRRSYRGRRGHKSQRSIYVGRGGIRL